MDGHKSIPNAEIPDDMDFIKKVTVVAISVFMIAVAWVIWQFLVDELTAGPSAEALQRERDFDDLVHYDRVDDLSGEGVDVCIVDSGIDTGHPDLDGMVLAGWSDFISSKSAPYDDNGHGTMMAGILVADEGYTGIARDVDLYVAKALSGSGGGDDETVAEAIDWCVTSGVDIISLSLGGNASGFSIILGDAVEDAVDAAYDAGIVVVAAAGNDGGSDDDGDVASPGIVSTVICVGGVDVNGNIWSGSSIGDNGARLWPPKLARNSPNEKPEVVAPGHRVPVIMIGEDCEGAEYCWGTSSGTSAATVYVTGAIALLFEEYPDLQDGGTDMLDNLKQWIADSSKQRSGQENHDDYYGYGLLQIDALLNEAA
ncbi:MAG: S8 family serine peptidase [Euryarchaeota archaeon]|nr:S8 family serine peptidase [Euryarchaeota archaeon]